MCDTLAALAAATRNGVTLFAKNSDRLRDEPQVVERHAAATHPAGTELRCTHISIPQAAHTHAVLLCRPWWIWGAEMGLNEHGVAIGNEAVFARSPPHETPALLGMDLVRLGLERGATAQEALGVMIELLELHGQGGNCAHPGPQHYDNSFIIADRHQAFVLETIGRRWIVEPVTRVRAISNLFTIRTATQRSGDLDAWLQACGWPDSKDVGYAAAIGDPARLVSGPVRWARATELLEAQQGELDAAAVMRILRDHGPGEGQDPNWRPTATRGPICAHADDALPRGQTVNALVAELRPKRLLAWVSGGAAPCLSVFKPVFLDTPIPETGPTPTGNFDARSFWWRHDRLQRALLADPDIDLAPLRAQRDVLEAEFRRRIAEAIDGDVLQRRKVVEACWSEAMALEDRWRTDLRLAAA